MKRDFVDPEITVIKLLMEAVANDIPDASYGVDTGAPDEWN